MACIFAFGAAQDYLVHVPREMRATEEAAGIDDPSDRLDYICILGQGVAFGGAYRYRRENILTPAQGGVKAFQERIALSSANPLLLFYAALLDYGSAQTPLRAQMLSYLPADFAVGQVVGVA